MESREFFEVQSLVEENKGVDPGRFSDIGVEERYAQHLAGLGLPLPDSIHLQNLISSLTDESVIRKQTKEVRAESEAAVKEQIKKIKTESGYDSMFFEYLLSGVLTNEHIDTINYEHAINYSEGKVHGNAVTFSKCDGNEQPSDFCDVCVGFCLYAFSRSDVLALFADLTRWIRPSVARKCTLKGYGPHVKLSECTIGLYHDFSLPGHPLFLTASVDFYFTAS